MKLRSGSDICGDAMAHDGHEPLLTTETAECVGYAFALWLARVEPWGFFIVMAFIASGLLSDIWMRPVMKASEFVISVLLSRGLEQVNRMTGAK